MLTTGKLGFWGLTALVFGLMVGVGIYNLPQNMAAVATPGAVMLAWLITAAGILPLVIAFKWLSNHYPQYNAGLYQYAQAEFGNYAGFNIAWGYWLCTAFSNVAYGVMLNDSFGAFFPALLRHGWETVVFGSALIWLMYFIVAQGVKTAKTVNTLLAGIKVVMLVFIITIFAISFRLDLFDVQIWGKLPEIGGTMSQVKQTMMVTLFCFFGVEGAVMMSARAKRPKDVGRAGIAGFGISLVLYLAVSLLCFGLLTRAQLAGLPDPSIAYILREACGDWAYWFVISAVIISLLGGWVAWTLVVAQVPYEAALVGILPRAFRRVNRQGMPTYGLVASSIVMELFLLMVVMADDVYLAALQITGLMIIPCYFFTGLFLLKKADTRGMKAVAAIATGFCLWMAWAGGLKEMLMTSVFYLAGIGFYIKSRRDNGTPDERMMTRGEKVTFYCLVVASVVTLGLIFSMMYGRAYPG
ncbi:MAG: amino acid permease [Muribaculaceae bacterium]|nr:amino acid permease [Muribaculaceae bacterium]